MKTADPVPMKHDTPEFKAIADDNTILRAKVGSRLHGTATPISDHDEMGICIEPPDYVIGLRKFEQYEHRTQPRGAPSGPGDLDYICYSLRKWARMAAEGRFSVLLPLFAPKDQLLDVKWPGHDLRARRDLFISRAAGPRFVGYLDETLKTRFDPGLAAHACRLGLQGAELLATGKITLPMSELERWFLLEIRNGERAQNEVLVTIGNLRDKLVGLCETSILPESAHWEAINSWLSDMYREWWRN